ncbi:MAG: AAA family ATPase [Candidatus Cloacimonetes bacterium]|nr:AAA family ATPase [Candidatus Cloacimonadota bacterium]
MKNPEAFELYNEWVSSKDYWLKKISSLAFSNEAVSDDDLNMIINDYVNNSFQTFQYELPQENNSSIILRSVDNISGVNRLLSDQILEFDENLTLIYGDNGVGKTGYSRIFQQLGKTIEKSVRPIKSNVLITPIIPKARIKFSYIDKKEESSELLWEQGKNQQLNIRLFNTNCVKFSLSETREISFKPAIFCYIDIIRDATTRLQQKVKKIIEESQQIISTTNVISGTIEYDLLSKVFLAPNIEEPLKLLDTYYEKIDLSFEQIDSQLLLIKEERDNNNVKVIGAQNSVILQEKTRLTNLINLITQSICYSNAYWLNLANTITKLDDLKNSNIEPFISQLDFISEHKDAFIAFLSAANNLLKQYSKDNNFSNSSTCLLCKQPIESKDTKELFHSYEKLISSIRDVEIKSTQVKLDNYMKEIGDFILQLKTVKCQFVQTSIDKQCILAIDSIISSINAEIEQYKKGLTTSICIEFDLLLSPLKKQEATFELSLREKTIEYGTVTKKLQDIQEKENHINSAKYILNKKEQIYKAVNILYSLYALYSIDNKSISKCQKTITDKLYSDEILAEIKNILIELNAPTEIVFDTSIATSQISLKQGYHSQYNTLSDVLSEGEQTVVALAQFIADANFNTNDNVLIFDDPVNSLDLNRMSEVAKVLVNLSKKKQVIIFTHNLVFVSCIKEHSKDKKAFACYYVENALLEGELYSGKLTKHFSPNIETYKNYNSEINKIANMGSKITLANVIQGYEYMRSALELLVCDILFNKTIERFKPNISIDSFDGVNGNIIEEERTTIVNLFHKVCRYISGHSSSPLSKINPTIQGFKEDIKTMQDIYSRINIKY